jgi:hypothetical protein
VVLPIAAVLHFQLVANARRAADLEHSRPLRILAAEARVVVWCCMPFGVT